MQSARAIARIQLWRIVTSMCGIATLVGRSGSSRLDRVIASLAHRRLAIIDLEGGRQPILGPAGQSALVHNGMIYNYQALRGDLSAARFNTETDSETILHLIARDGPAAVRQLDGMFAFVIAEGDRVVAARDPVGIKPLYIGEAPRRHLLRVRNQGAGRCDQKYSGLPARSCLCLGRRFRTLLHRARAERRTLVGRGCGGGL